MTDQPFEFVQASAPEVPILVSVPHCGTVIPDQIQEQMSPAMASKPRDTDWHVDRLYEFAPSLGISMIRAVYSRYVIDLNRSCDGQPLYADGRQETSLVPVKSFAGEQLYPTKPPDKQDIADRIERYYAPYHRELERQLRHLRRSHEQVILIEGHSIRRSVPLLHKDPFPDLILGDQHGSTCAGSFSEISLKSLAQGPFQVSYNHPFRGGYITRNYGKPATGIHAIQLEMSQDLYMDEQTYQWDEKSAPVLQKVLQHWLQDLCKALST